MNIQPFLIVNPLHYFIHYSFCLDSGLKKSFLGNFRTFYKLSFSVSNTFISCFVAFTMPVSHSFTQAIWQSDFIRVLWGILDAHFVSLSRFDFFKVFRMLSKESFHFFNGPVSMTGTIFEQLEKEAGREAERLASGLGFASQLRSCLVLHPLLPQLRSLTPRKDWVNWSKFYWNTLGEVLKIETSILSKLKYECTSLLKMLTGLYYLQYTV